MEAALETMIRRLGGVGREIAPRGLQLLVLHGSRARGSATPHSDWDFAFLATSEFDVDELVAALVEAVGHDRVDCADLSRSSGLLRIRAASEGIAIFEDVPERFNRFRLEAITAWCDMAPVLLPAYERELARLAS